MLRDLKKKSNFVNNRGLNKVACLKLKDLRIWTRLSQIKVHHHKLEKVKTTKLKLRVEIEN